MSVSGAFGLILDIGHAGKPRPKHLDQGAVCGPRAEAVLAKAYVEAAAELCAERGIPCHVLQPPAEGWSYVRRHAEAARLARGAPSTRWLYVQAHLNSAERDPRYGLVGYDPRSGEGKRAAQNLANALERNLTAAIGKARAEAAEGDWSRMLGTIEGIWDGPDNLCGVCYEPAFIQSDLWAQPDAAARVALALVDGAAAWGAT